MKPLKILGLLVLGVVIIGSPVLAASVMNNSTLQSADMSIKEPTLAPTNEAKKIITAEEQNSADDANNPMEQQYPLSAEGLAAYFKENGKTTERYGKIEINEKYINDEVFYFAVVRESFSWGSELYRIQATNGMITGVIATGVGGNDWLFEYDVIEISQGKFIAAYSASHAGNGDLLLIPLDAPGKPQYSVPAIDHHYEYTEETAIAYGLSDGYGNDIYASGIFLSGKLHADYEDINNDGNTDIILKGIQQVYEHKEEEDILQNEFMIKTIYVFDAGSDGFVLSGAKQS